MTKFSENLFQKSILKKTRRIWRLNFQKYFEEFRNKTLKSSKSYFGKFGNKASKNPKDFLKIQK